MSGPGDSSGVPQPTRERLALREAQYAAARARGEEILAAQRAMDATRGTASSYLGEVTATVSARGLLTDLQITPRGAALGPRVLGRLVSTTIREALLDLEGNLIAAVDETGHSEASAALVAEVTGGLRGPLAALDDTDAARQQ